MRNLYCVLLLAALLLLPAPRGDAMSREIESGIGIIKVPVQAWVTDFDMTGFYSFLFNTGAHRLGGDISPDSEQYRKMQETVRQMDEVIKQLNIYDIVMDNNGSYQRALAMTFFLDKGLPGRVNPNAAGRDDSISVKPEWYPGIVEMQERIKRSAARELAQSAKRKPGDILKIVFDDDLEKSFLSRPPELLKLDWPEIEIVNVNGGLGYKSDLRIAGRLFGVINGIYIKFLAYDVKNDGVAFVLLATMDNEHDFWAPVFADMLDVEPMFEDMFVADESTVEAVLGAGI